MTIPSPCTGKTAYTVAKMSGLDVEALLDSTAAPADSKDQTPRDRDERHKSDRKDSHHHKRDGSKDRDKDRRRRDRSRDRGRRDKDAEGDDLMKSPIGSANGSLKSRRRSRSRDDDRRHSRRHRDSTDHDDRDPYRASGGDYYRGGGFPRRRSRSPNDDRYYRPGGLGRDDDGKLRERSPRRDRNGGRRRTPSPKRKSKSPTPQPTEDERDRRTVFVQQLAARLRTKELIQFFEKVGPVKEAQIVKDRVSGRSKGYVDHQPSSFNILKILY